MTEHARLVYERDPRYRTVGGQVECGFAALAAALPPRTEVLAIDGPAFLHWGALMDGLTRALAEQGVAAEPLDVRSAHTAWEKILDRTSTPRLADDPHFEKLAEAEMAEFFDGPAHFDSPGEGVRVVYGPGSALVGHDVLWYADLPKRYAEAAVKAGEARNLGQPDGAGTLRRLFYVDWPVLDRHRDSLAGGIDRFIDTQPLATGDGSPASVSGACLRDTMLDLAARPLRARPFFNSVSWGGHWAQRELGFRPEAPNTALGYELIAPENGVLVGAAAERGQSAEETVEIPFQMIVAQHPVSVLGERVYEVFGTSFPIRFDYLDTVGGGNLSVHVHPRHAYMRDVFGWPYTQHETYYVTAGGPGKQVYLGLREDADVDAFHAQADRAAREAAEFDPGEHVSTFPAEDHQLFLIPAGTPHASGEGNLVLEISATPYLYSLRFFDWLRRDAADGLRPVHVEHAFANLDTERRGAAVRRDLVPEPQVLRAQAGFREELLGGAPEMFFEVRRLVVEDIATDRTDGGFHVLNLVEGDGVLVETDDGVQHELAFAETLVVPAAVGGYRLHRMGEAPCRVVKALVR